MLPLCVCSLSVSLSLASSVLLARRVNGEWLHGRWIAAHAALGYTATDMFLRGRSLASDIPNLDKHRA